MAENVDVRTYAQLECLSDRYYYLTLRLLSSPASPIGIITQSVFSDFRRYMACDEYARYAYADPHIHRGLRNAKDLDGGTFVGDTIASSPGCKQRWKKLVRINYDIAQRRTGAGDLIMPYSMHPLQYAWGLGPVLN